MIRNVLLIQQDPAEAEAIRQRLLSSPEESFKVVWVRGCAEGLAELGHEAMSAESAGGHIAAILLDLSAPSTHGLESVAALVSASPHTPILVLCTAQSEEIAKAAVQHGAQDYLLKTPDGHPLRKAVDNMIERCAISDALFEEKERAQVTLNSIGDAVLSVNVRGQRHLSQSRRRAHDRLVAG